MCNWKLFCPRAPSAPGERTVISATGPNGHRWPWLVCPVWSPATLKDRAVNRTCRASMQALGLERRDEERVKDSEKLEEQDRLHALCSGCKLTKVHNHT